MKTVQKIAILLILQLLCMPLLYGQDTLSVPVTKKRHFKAEPLKATMLAVALPGAGQIYNRKYWKIPLVYAGFGALFYTAGVNGKNYSTYIKAYQDFTDAIPETNSYLKIIPGKPQDYDPVLYPLTYKPENYSYYKDEILRLVDFYKRYRDLSYIGIGAWYLLTILDANVDASLYNFDVSNNLNLTLAPTLMPLPGGYTGAALSASLTWTF